MLTRADWRQVRKWEIDENLIPADTVAYFKEPTFWEAYRTAALITAAIILVQAALIATLLLERRRRRSAESAVQKQRMEEILEELRGNRGLGSSGLPCFGGSSTYNCRCESSGVGTGHGDTFRLKPWCSTAV